MIELNGNTVEERRQWLSKLLQSGTYTVTFTKVDGTVREMPCTLRADLLPPEPVHVTNTDNPVDFPAPKKEKKVNPENLSVWCVDKKEWRSFKVMNVTAVAEYVSKENSWVVTLEEDPETGDLIMPLPDEVLKSQGWEIGDTLVWDVDKKQQSITLSKNDQDSQES